MLRNSARRDIPRSLFSFLGTIGLKHHKICFCLFVLGGHLDCLRSQSYSKNDHPLYCTEFFINIYCLIVGDRGDTLVKSVGLIFKSRLKRGTNVLWIVCEKDAFSTVIKVSKGLDLDGNLLI